MQPEAVASTGYRALPGALRVGVTGRPVTPTREARHRNPHRLRRARRPPAPQRSKSRRRQPPQITTPPALGAAAPTGPEAITIPPPPTTQMPSRPRNPSAANDEVAPQSDAVAARSPQPAARRVGELQRARYRRSHCVTERRDRVDVRTPKLGVSRFSSSEHRALRTNDLDAPSSPRPRHPRSRLRCPH